MKQFGITEMKSLDRNFSEATKAMIAESRKIAIDLGYDYISTVHFLLADCRIGGEYSIKNFIFKTNEDLETFYTEQKKGEASVSEESIPLTKEAEQTVKKGCKLWSSSEYRDNKIFPYHFFLAASRLKSTFFYLHLEATAGLFEILEQYYLEIGQIRRENIHQSKSLWSWLSKR